MLHTIVNKCITLNQLTTLLNTEEDWPWIPNGNRDPIISGIAFVSKVRTALVSLAGEGVSLVVVAVVLAAVTSVLLLLGTALACRRKGTRCCAASPPVL